MWPFQYPMMYLIVKSWKVSIPSLYIYCVLTHPRLDKMVTISQTIFLKWIFMNEKFVFWFEFHLSPNGPIYKKTLSIRLVQAIAWRRTGDKPLPEPMLTQFANACAALGGVELKPLYIFDIWRVAWQYWQKSDLSKTEMSYSMPHCGYAIALQMNKCHRVSSKWPRLWGRRNEQEITKQDSQS